MSHPKEIPRPEWMDDEFLETSIKTLNVIGDKSNLQIKEVTLSYVVPKGENYASVLYRANVGYVVDGRASEESLIMKVSHGLNSRMGRIFKKETEILRDIVPALSEILQRNNLNPRFACRYANSSSGDPQVLVMDDLRPLGYVMLDRTKGLNLHHTKMILNKLAQYHASTMCYLEKQDEALRLKYSQTPFSSNSEERGDSSMKLAVQKRVETIVAELTKHDQYKKAAQFFQRYAASFEGMSMTSPPLETGGKLNALAHADFWINNIMFKYDNEGTLEDLVFVDFQATHYTSVAYDIHYILWTSTSNEVKKSHFEECLRYYFESLVGYMKMFGFGGEMPTFEDFERELKRSMFVVMLIIVVMLPLILKSYTEEVQSRDNSSEGFSMHEIVDMIGEGQTGDLLTETVLASVDILSKHGYFDSYPE